jgi:hypothetical protein
VIHVLCQSNNWQNIAIILGRIQLCLQLTVYFKYKFFGMILTLRCVKVKALLKMGRCYKNGTQHTETLTQYSRQWAPLIRQPLFRLQRKRTSQSHSSCLTEHTASVGLDSRLSISDSVIRTFPHIFHANVWITQVRQQLLLSRAS